QGMPTGAGSVTDDIDGLSQDTARNPDQVRQMHDLNERVQPTQRFGIAADVAVGLHRDISENCCTTTGLALSDTVPVVDMLNALVPGGEHHELPVPVAVHDRRPNVIREAGACR